MAIRKRGNRIDGRFVPLEYHILDAFRERKVGANAIVAYILLKKNFNPMMHGEKIILTYSEAGGWMAPATFSRALRELEKAGFIEKVQCGGLALGRDPGKCASIYRFTNKYK